MKRQVYVFDEYVSSQKNGIGSFLGEFLYCMKQIDVDICLLVFNANVEEFTIVEEKGMEKMLFPSFLLGDFTDNAEIVSKFLRLYIPDSPRNVFFVNHSPCERLLSEIKKTHTQSKLIFIIHDLGWTSAFIGDVMKYRQMIHEEEPIDTCERHKQIMFSYNEERKMYALADRVVCLSHDTLELLQDTYFVHSDKIVWIPNGLREQKNSFLNINRDKLRQKLLVSQDDKILLFAGRPTRKKGAYALLEAFGFVLAQEPNARLVIAGFDNSNNIEKLIIVSSVYAPRITFTGLIDRERLNEWYTVADVGIIPSYYEQCPYTGIEMMRCGLPVVASDAYGLRNMFQESVNARIARIGDRENSEEFVRNMAIAILDVLTSRKLCKELSEGSEAIFQSVYHIRNMTENYKRLLDSL